MIIACSVLGEIRGIKIHDQEFSEYPETSDGIRTYLGGGGGGGGGLGGE